MYRHAMRTSQLDSQLTIAHPIRLTSGHCLYNTLATTCGVVSIRLRLKSDNHCRLELAVSKSAHVTPLSDGFLSKLGHGASSRVVRPGPVRVYHCLQILHLFNETSAFFHHRNSINNCDPFRVALARANMLVLGRCTDLEVMHQTQTHHKLPRHAIGPTTRNVGAM